ncbi:N-acetylmuramoyl-L-alanine amidase [Romboutsia sedimentorum]|uniref:N-acetylmuramoyl-L-alanine amidase n=1 Tax=Romboutsia sedimentorum TaxID=1368474 RepID=A0ABT7E657_9FIRM|nr:N-acetylmuramoyl-L-alanine amidase [Romboutsia sedimentorum]MDK2562408.1 N-acetylmuramoyl-L-alanine amidase [Romboutsia sedimentorum]MDK2584644.1 N-acetylmuramoyl-L-alanine amidase [Romboutsia sedimentorum]
MAKKVFIDPGHGGTDSGAVGVDNLLEKNINLQVARKVEELLKKQGLDVKLSRYSDETVSLGSRTNNANAWKADCFISIHCNAFNEKASGIETYSHTTATNNLANNIHYELLNTKAYSANRGTKSANYYVLRNSSMRACLVELGFIDNKADAKFLTQNQDALALGIAKGICRYLNVEYKPASSSTENPKPPVTDSETFYRVVCGSYNNKVYAEEKVEELKDLGMKDVFIVGYKKQ